MNATPRFEADHPAASWLYMRQSRVAVRVLRTLGPFAVLLLVWWLLAILGPWSSQFLPRPGDVLTSGWELIHKGILPVHIISSLEKLILASAIGLCVSIPVGLLLGINPAIGAMFQPFVNFFQSITEIAWLPLVLLVSGFTTRTMVIVICYTIFFPVLFNTMLGVRQVPLRMIQASRTLGAGTIPVVLHVIIPGAFPSIVAGIRVGISYGWRALIASEIIAGSRGLGYLIFDARNALATARVIVGMVVIGVTWILTDRLFLRPLEEATIERWGLVHREGGLRHD